MPTVSKRFIASAMISLVPDAVGADRDGGQLVQREHARVVARRDDRAARPPGVDPRQRGDERVDAAAGLAGVDPGARVGVAHAALRASATSAPAPDRRAIGGVGAQRAAALEHRDQPQREQRGDERRGRTGHHAARDLRRHAAPRQARALQRRGAEDHRQRDLAGDHVRVGAAEAQQARGRQRRSVARHAGRERERLRESDRERVERARLVALALFGRAVGERHRGGSGEQGDGHRAQDPPAAARSAARRGMRPAPPARTTAPG